MKGVSYQGAPPRTYRCSGCKVRGVKLWRPYNTCAPSLLCGPCALEDQGKTGPIDSGGKRTDDYGGSTDQIGWWVPAVPDEEGVGYWGYSSVPEEGVAWWRALPLLPKGET